MAVITVTLPEELKAKVSVAAVAEDRSESSLVRQAIKSYLELEIDRLTAIEKHLCILVNRFSGESGK